MNKDGNEIAEVDRFLKEHHGCVSIDSLLTRLFKINLVIQINQPKHTDDNTTARISIININAIERSQEIHFSIPPTSVTVKLSSVHVNLLTSGRLELIKDEVAILMRQATYEFFVYYPVMPQPSDNISARGKIMF